VIVNKAIEGNRLVDDYCRDKNIDIIQRIPYREEIARAYAKGDLIIDLVAGMRDLFKDILQCVLAKTKRVSA